VDVGCEEAILDAWSVLPTGAKDVLITVACAEVVATAWVEGLPAPATEDVPAA
jgi:hypothetical protein